ncbi:hypothetical protein NL676_037828 [Syzygium grande]|nr:hypothetical protein NL676_037828 [Syzygium grande]
MAPEFPPDSLIIKRRKSCDRRLSEEPKKTTESRSVGGERLGTSSLRACTCLSCRRGLLLGSAPPRWSVVEGIGFGSERALLRHRPPPLD